MIKMQNIENVDRHVHERVTMNVIQFENFEFAQRCVMLVVSVRKDLF